MSHQQKGKREGLNRLIESDALKYHATHGKVVQHTLQRGERSSTPSIISGWRPAPALKLVFPTLQCAVAELVVPLRLVSPTL